MKKTKKKLFNFTLGGSGLFWLDPWQPKLVFHAGGSRLKKNSQALNVDLLVQAHTTTHQDDFQPYSIFLF